LEKLEIYKTIDNTNMLISILGWRIKLQFFWFRRQIAASPFS